METDRSTNQMRPTEGGAKGRRRSRDASVGDGVEHVIVGGMDDFRAQHSTLAGKLGATVAFDAVAGDLTRDLLAALPDGSEVVVFGRLSGKDVRFDGLAYLSGRHMKLSAGSGYAGPASRQPVRPRNSV